MYRSQTDSICGLKNLYQFLYLSILSFYLLLHFPKTYSLCEIFLLRRAKSPILVGFHIYSSGLEAECCTAVRLVFSWVETGWSQYLKCRLKKRVALLSTKFDLDQLGRLQQVSVQRFPPHSDISKLIKHNATLTSLQSVWMFRLELNLRFPRRRHWMFPTSDRKIRKKLPLDTNMWFVCVSFCSCQWSNTNIYQFEKPKMQHVSSGASITVNLVMFFWDLTLPRLVGGYRQTVCFFKCYYLSTTPHGVTTQNNIRNFFYLWFI
jgi:hypothetical protein